MSHLQLPELPPLPPIEISKTSKTSKRDSKKPVLKKEKEEIKGKKERETFKPTLSPVIDEKLATELREDILEQIPKISKEIGRRENFQNLGSQKSYQESIILPDISKKGKEEESSINIKTGKTLEMVKSGAITALDLEPQAAFQPKLTGLIRDRDKDENISLSTVASPANLPAKKKRDTTPKIKIPNLSISGVKNIPDKQIKLQKGEINLPKETTIVPPIPIASPSTMNISKTKKIDENDKQLIEIISQINMEKLTAEKGLKRDQSYNVQELKSIAGSLNLPKSGNKKELVERIKTEILKINPSAF